MADNRILIPPSGYDAVANPRIASFAAQLDDQLARLLKSVDALDVAQLEWQPRAGCNTIGMLLAHLAVVDVWWISIAPTGATPGPATDAVFRSVIGIGMDDDGLPCPPEGGHPASLSGCGLSDYAAMLHAARASTNTVMRTWRDADLATTYRLRDRDISYEWTIYHVLEHFASHYGQVLLLLHLLRQPGPPA